MAEGRGSTRCGAARGDHRCRKQRTPRAETLRSRVGGPNGGGTREHEVRSGPFIEIKFSQGEERVAESSAKYLRVVEWIRDEISAGRLQKGQKLMSEQELSERFGLSRQTIRHATGELVNEGLLVRRQGSGTFVNGKAVRAVSQVRHGNIAVITTYVDSYIFPLTIKGIENVLSQADYTTQIYFTDDLISRETLILKSLLGRDDIDGIIVEAACAALPNPNLKYYRQLQEKGIPIIFFNASYPGLEAPCVRVDDEAAAETMTRLLIDAGHEKIGAILHSVDRQGHLRYKGYLKALSEAGLTYDPRTTIWVDMVSFWELDQLSEMVIRRLEDCTAVLCYNDEIARQLLEIADKKGIWIPDKLSVASLDDSDLSRIGKVEITSYPHPKEALGRKVAENIIKMIEDPGFDGNYLFRSVPVLRDSVSQCS